MPGQIDFGLNESSQSVEDQLEEEDVSKCFSDSTSKWSRRIHARAAAAKEGAFLASIAFGSLSQEFSTMLLSDEERQSIPQE
eukprot:1211536-Rhodomonas_salina.1